MKNVVLAATIAAALALAGCARINSLLGNGEKELAGAFAAKKAAKSWKMKVDVRLHPGRSMETISEVSCPDRQRITTNVGGKHFQTVRVGNTFFTRLEDGRWMKNDASGINWSPCGEGLGTPAPWAIMNEGRDMTTVLATVAGNAEITRGSRVQLDSGSCREWSLSMKHPGQEKEGAPKRGLSYRICIDDQHHPRRIATASDALIIQYYDWDKPVDITAPEAAVDGGPVQRAASGMTLPAGHGMGGNKPMPPGHPAVK